MLSAALGSQDEQIATYILDHLSYNENQQLLCYLWGPVSAGDKILGTKEMVYDIPSAGYVMYIDLYPTANLFHPVQYVFLKEPTQELTVFDAQSPPLNFNDYRVVDTPFSQFFFSIGNTKPVLPEKTPLNSNKAEDNRYAVLMNGGYDSGNNHVRYWNDLQNIYITLNYVYEIPDENIIVLCSDGLNPAVDQSNGQNSNPDLDGDGDDDIMYSCVLSNVDYVFTSLAANLTATDKLFVFTTDHGGSVSGWDVIENLWNHEELTDYHFQELLAAFPDCEKICTFEPCFSGGFLDNIIVPPGPIVASSACSYSESSWAMAPDYVYDEYVFYWTAAIKGEDAYGVPVNADANSDGVVTMDEAYSFAVTHDTASESPQYGEYPDGTGAATSLWVSSNPPASPVKPTGPTHGLLNVSYSFTSQTTDPDGDDIFYQFGWDDGSQSEWLGPYSSGTVVVGSHAWSTVGNYSVKVKAKDIHGARSQWSEPIIISIVLNDPPDTPTISGPASGSPGKPYLYKLQTIDTNGDDVYYYIEWGDGTITEWIGPYHSGMQATTTHSWNEKGNYTMKVKAKDVMGDESDWGTMDVVMPTVLIPPILGFLAHLFERFPHAFPILRHLLGY
jgi:hypothetical protein